MHWVECSSCGHRWRVDAAAHEDPDDLACPECESPWVEPVAYYEGWNTGEDAGA